ncbi:uncharacterized protein LOC117239713 [Bombus vosnesenskii]|uniref:Uncharacterized protein LOC117239713 n=1 Tax=Bombus vosnesenskii TaxID=207650 RepID=A0A6J3L7W9_9HYME|nr:uncharacterized protein LOC117239713 [Bombus vosnesenskii]
MALSDVLQFDCSIENEIAQNALKNFTGMLGKAFEQYKKLWNEYLKLQKYCGNITNIADFKIPCELFESDIFSNKDVIISANNQVLKNTKIFPHEDINCDNNFRNCDYISNVDNAVLIDRSVKCQIQEDKLLKSPILKNEMNLCLPIKTDISSLTNLKSDIMQNPLSQDSKENECSIIENSNDEINTSINTTNTKMSKKLGVSKSYNVDTTLLKNGKNHRQSKLVLLEDKQSTDIVTQKKHNRSDFLTAHVSPRKGIREQFKNYNNSIEEDIIQNSPNKRIKLSSKMRSLKLKRKTPKKEINQHSLDRHLLPLQKSVQENRTHLITEPKIFDFCNENVNSNDKTQKNFNSAKEETDSNSSSDKTFCTLGESLQEHSPCNINKLKENVPKTKSVRRTLMNSFDMLPAKEYIFDKSPKKKSERAQMNGVSCWQCKQYYTSLGLSEEEIRMRQNKCSRHRTKYNERNETPEDFWNPLFPDTTSDSSY